MGYQLCWDKIPGARRQGYDERTAMPRGMEGEFEEIAREMASLAVGLGQVLSQELRDDANESQCLEDFDLLFNTTDPFWNVSQGALALDAFGKPRTRLTRTEYSVPWREHSFRWQL